MHSPHTSPKMLRKALAAGLQEKEAASSSSKQNISNGKPSKPPPPVTSSSSSSASSSSSSSVSSICKAPLIDLSSSESSIGANKENQNFPKPAIKVVRSISASESPPLRSMSSTQDQDAPPIPPRKSMNVDSSRPMKPQPALPVAEKIEDPPVIEEKQSPVPKAPVETYDDDEEDPICGPAETITGENHSFRLLQPRNNQKYFQRNHRYPPNGTPNKLHKLRVANEQRDQQLQSDHDKRHIEQCKRTNERRQQQKLQYISS